ncbi:MAG: VCBS repeat-containing protein, partial [Segetibacter sp.]
PQYADKSHEYGLDFSGFSSQAAFFDYDLDGDLDMFLLNHSVHEKGNDSPRKSFMGTYHPLSGDRMYRNDGNHFTDVTRETGLNSSAISYGLGVVVADINLDGYPDLYVGNDFHENDYLYINQKNGTFKEELNEQIMHTSQYTMGVDAADVTNDGLPEIISVDMLPADPLVLKRSLGGDEYDIFNQKIDYGYNYQYTRNNLQYNRENGMFSEVGLYSGIAATDWSWAPLWVDFDNDGVKDLFISTGIPKRMNDIDYINFISDRQVQQKIQDNKMNETNAILIDKFPTIKIPNKFFRNTGDLHFQDLEQNIADNKPTYSNGAVYADFDNDGDIDIIVNNIDDQALLYENTNNEINKTKSLRIKVKGPGNNINGVGSKLFVFANNSIRLYEKNAVHGFLSSMETPMTIGLGNTKIDSMFFVWPDNTYQTIHLPKDTSAIVLSYQQQLPNFDYKKITSFKQAVGFHVEDITAKAGLNYLHTENAYSEFDLEPLIPHMFSTEGPALAVADINNDGMEDVFLGSSKGGQNGIFIPTTAGKFVKLNVSALARDSMFENVSATWADVNNDG